MLTQFAFRVSTPDNLLCQFTRQHPDAMVVITPLITSPGEVPDDAMYTILCPNTLATSLVENHFEKEYGDYEVVDEHPDALSVRVPLKLPELPRGGDPLAVAYDLLGEDAIVLPLTAVNGHLHCTMVTASPEGRNRFVQFATMVREMVQPETFNLIHVGPYDPAPEIPKGNPDLTERQRQVLDLATAMGYYATPRECTLEDLAQIFGISKAAVHKSLVAAERKIVHAHLKHDR